MEYGLQFLGLAYLLFVLFVAGMNIKRVKNEGRLPRSVLILSIPLIVFGAVLDCLMNLTVASVVFWEIPKEWTVSQRVSRWEKKEGVRRVIAVWICQNLLNLFDPGHCQE